MTTFLVVTFFFLSTMVRAIGQDKKKVVRRVLVWRPGAGIMGNVSEWGRQRDRGLLEFFLNNLKVPKVNKTRLSSCYKLATLVFSLHSGNNS